MEKSMIIPVVGVTFENRQDILNEFFKNYHCGGKYLIKLVKEDDNPYDKNAVAVYFEDTNQKIGFISKNENEFIRKEFDNIKEVVIHSVNPNSKGIIAVSIVVYFN